MKQFLLILTLFFAIYISSCEITKFPIEPQIEFISIGPEVVIENQDSIVVTISFTDGDGDLGIHESDTVSTDVTYKLIAANSEDFDSKARLPVITPSGNSKAISGEIELTFQSLFLIDPPFTTDTIQYEIFIKDRAGHESNTILTDKIIIQK